MESRGSAARGAVRHHLRADSSVTVVVDAAFREDCALLGLDPDKLVTPNRQLHAPETYELWHRYAAAWDVFTRCRTQWVWVPVGMAAPMRVGLDYSAVNVLLDVAGLRGKKRRSAWWAIQVLEDEALEVFYSRR